MPDDEPHRSRTAWPGPLSIAGVGEGHDHKLPEALIKRVRSQGRALFVIGGCFVAIGALLLLIIFARGAERDAEDERQNQRINDAICDLLDQLPEGGLLDRPRDKYGCGPGIPLSELPEDVRRRYESQTAPPTPAPTPAPAAEAPPIGSPAIPNPPRPTPSEPPATTPPKPTPSPASPSGRSLGPITETVCDLTDICTEEIP